MSVEINNAMRFWWRSGPRGRERFRSDLPFDSLGVLRVRQILLLNISVPKISTWLGVPGQLASGSEFVAQLALAPGRLASGVVFA